MAYGNTLSTLLSGAKPPIGAPPATLGMGAPPSMPGLPPAPTGIGAMPTGDPSTTKKAAADQAILALRECKGHYPELGTLIDGTIDGLKSAAQKTADAPSAPVGAPSPPGAAATTAAPVMESGTPGSM